MSSIAAATLRFLPQANTGGYEENASGESGIDNYRLTFFR
jgi:hypothetical protein